MQARFISPHQAQALQAEGAVLVDVRNPEEWRHGIAPGAVCISLPVLRQSEAHGLLPADRERPVMLVCASAQRSATAAELLIRRGYHNLAVVRGGMRAWKESALPLVAPDLSEADMRYDRQLRLPQWGPKAQEALGRAHVLLIGAGGLGSPAALYLAAAGVGRLTIVDDDVVELSNLQRQIMHGTDTLGQLKVRSAQARLQALNPLVQVATVTQKLDRSNAEDLIEAADVVIDGSDNLATRYLVNAVCQRIRVPLVYAAVYQFEAQIATFDFRRPDSPCYACLFPPANSEEPESCAVAGVLGVVPGLAGIFQATEALKLVTGVGDSLQGRLLTCDLLENRFRSLKLQRDQHCPVCSSSPAVIQQDKP